MEGRAVFSFSRIRNSSFYIFFISYFLVSISLSSSHESFQFVLNTFYFSSSWEVRGPSGKDNPAVIKTLQLFNILRRKHFLLNFKSLSKVVWSCRRHLHGKWCAQTEPKTPKANLSPNCTWYISQERDLFQVITMSKYVKRDSWDLSHNLLGQQVELVRLKWWGGLLLVDLSWWATCNLSWW